MRDAIHTIAVGLLLLGAPARGGGMERPPVNVGDLSAGTVMVLEVLDRAPGTNQVASPPSMDIAIAALREGAAGPTRKAIDRVLPPTIPVPATGSGRTTFATSVWTREGFPPREGYQARVKAGFGAVVMPLPAVDAAGAVNRWASQATGGRIREVVDRVDPSVRLILASAAWFRGSWRVPFDSRTTGPAPFTRADGFISDVPTMRRTGSLAYRATERFRSVQIPFAEGNEVLELVLPGAGVTATGALREALAPGHPSRLQGIRLWVPRFELAGRVDLREPLLAIGLGSLFDPRSVDLSGIAGEPGELFVGSMRHDALLRVDEAGVEAAAVTTAVLVGSILPDVELKLDRPFLAILRASPDGPPIFIGYVANPATR